ncbi:hypothetical protein AsFcp4_227 [Aeromonas phage AsFcp_4]|uniref:Uncharacterized protein n=1 Tax=Aeromonas phage PX29 TaxID=926067 RepID=E5DQ02_9CAUD|nr:hypothetical protein CL89_gp069 [Aeromonas phage PX29]ADQ52788.1 conserved hypothetical protein [Aeromonas phage PX29]QAX99680.1 hypothetical protein AsFcp4_227 [Aeromonas phage AsFcp_4]
MQNKVAIEVLSSQIKYLQNQIESSYDEVWTPEGADKRDVWEKEIESILHSIYVLETNV